MSKNLKILVAQLNPVVGDIAGNLALARAAHAEATAKGADLVVLSEHFILGYPAEDLVVVYFTQLLPARNVDDHDKLRVAIYQALLE